MFHKHRFVIPIEYRIVWDFMAGVANPKSPTHLIAVKFICKCGLAPESLEAKDE